MRGWQADRRLIARSGLFDPNHYLIEGPDVAREGVDPLTHFCTFGAAEGRRPNPYFDPAWYREVYLGGAPAGANPLAHYIRGGEAADCRPVCYFEPAWYRRTYGLGRRTSPLGHFLAHRRSQRFAPNHAFDRAHYLARHGDAMGPNRDPFAHFLRASAIRDLDPSAAFSAAAYRARHMTGPERVGGGLSGYEGRVPLVHRLDRLARAAQDGRERLPEPRWRRLLRPFLQPR